MDTIIKEFKKLKLEDWALIAFICSRVITWVFTSVIGAYGIYVSMFLVFLLYVAVLVKKLRKKEMNLFLLFLIVAMSLTILALYSAIGDRFRAQWLFFDMENGLLVKVFDPRKGIFALFIVLMIGDLKRVLHDLQLASYILASYLIFHVILFLINGNWDSYFSVKEGNTGFSKYNMHVGYGFATCFLVLEDKYLKNKMKIDKVFALISAFSAIYFGPRGIIPVIVAFYVLQFLFNADREQKNRVLFSFLGTFLFIVIVSFGMEKIQTFLIDTFYSKGNVTEEIEGGSRTVDAFMTGEISESNGRLRLWGYAIDAIKDSPLLGHGLFGDRPYVGKGFRWGYSHNMILELWASFGLIGVLFFLGIVYYIFRFLFLKEYKKERSLLIIIISSCVKLLISDSFLFLDMFWFFIGAILLLETKYKTWSWKPLATISAALFLINVLGLGFYVKTAAARQINYKYRSEKPTAVIVFEGTFESDYTHAFKFMSEKNIVGTSFISGKYVNTDHHLSSDMIKTMAQSGWDFQDNFYSQDNLLKATKHSLDQSIEKTDQLFKELGLQQPTVMASFYSRTNEALLSDRFNERNMLLTSKYDIADGSYHTISPIRSLELQIYEPHIAVHNKKDAWKAIKKEIQKNKKNDNLFIVDFREINTREYEAFGHLLHFKKIINLLIDEGYEFKTMKEISNEIYMPKDQRTIKNLVKNFGL